MKDHTIDPVTRKTLCGLLQGGVNAIDSKIFREDDVAAERSCQHVLAGFFVSLAPNPGTVLKAVATPFSLVTSATALKMISVNRRAEKRLRKATEARDVFVSAARLLRLGIVGADPENSPSPYSTCTGTLAWPPGACAPAMSVLMLSATQTRWRDEWLGELHTLPTRRSRSRLATPTLFGVPRLAVTPRRPALRSGQGRP